MNKTTKRLRCGQVVRVEFYDHATGDKELKFAVYGEIGQINPNTICIDTWAYADKCEPHDENEERYTIVRSTITKITHLVEE